MTRRQVKRCWISDLQSLVNLLKSHGESDWGGPTRRVISPWLMKLIEGLLFRDDAAPYVERLIAEVRRLLPDPDLV